MPSISLTLHISHTMFFLLLLYFRLTNKVLSPTHMHVRLTNKVPNPTQWFFNGFSKVLEDSSRQREVVQVEHVLAVTNRKNKHGNGFNQSSDASCLLRVVKQNCGIANVSNLLTLLWPLARRCSAVAPGTGFPILPYFFWRVRNVCKKKKPNMEMDSINLPMPLASCV